MSQQNRDRQHVTSQSTQSTFLEESSRQVGAGLSGAVLTYRSRYRHNYLRDAGALTSPRFREPTNHL